MAQAAFAREPLARPASAARGESRTRSSRTTARSPRSIVAESGKPLAEAYVHDLIVAADACTLARRQPRGRPARGAVPPLAARPPAQARRGPPRAARRGRGRLAVELPARASAPAGGRRRRGGQRRRRQAVGADAAERRLVEELFRRAGAPPGLVRVVQGPGETVGDALVRHRGHRGVVFTGSTEVGRSVARAAADRLCPAVLELGGKDAMLVLDDADLDRAVEGALWGSFANCGQACAGIERIAVAPGLHDEFVERLAGARAHAAGRPRGGSATSSSARSSAEEPARTVRGRSSPMRSSTARTSLPAVDRPTTDLPGWFHEPTVLLGEPRAARRPGRGALRAGRRRCRDRQRR